MSVDERLRAHAPTPPPVDPTEPLALVHHRVRRRRTVRRAVAGAAVVLAVVALSAAAVRPRHHESRVTSNEVGRAVDIEAPEGYELVSDRTVAPETPYLSDDGDVLVLYAGADERAILVTSRPVPLVGADGRFAMNATVQGVPAAIYPQAGRVWIPHLGGQEVTLDAHGITAEADLQALAESLVGTDGHVVLRDPPAWSDHILTTGPHPLDEGSLTRRQLVLRSAGRHLVLDVVDGSTSTRVARWRHGGRAVADLGSGDAALVDREGERRLGWEQDGYSLALRTDDPAIGDDDLVAIARSVRFSP